ncbi:efflux RND transporter permease subunit [Sphaerotilus montanus]|uniref:HAE1 family hydrophobic/amphiphilic exporter-1 n=1 Tax=Sphaerotilus montanus TaxID=522889 RepID=A0A7Y9UHW6_9BURK|nr:efflux RND transporter permease subunit [Sphaerotilus montanus]NYG31095.1 HAE1 family hydrophobic/amphiphilic exporter-1 [Sphaerotilus montanus]NZD55081.1 efflux RND transporter permease subunit [Sphaerotilus montanus]
MWFTRISITNPVMATMAMLALVVLGLFSFQRLKVDQFPSVEFPTVVVSIDYPGASAEIVETEVTRKVEEAVNAIAGVNQINSRSYSGTSVVIVQFNLDLDSRRAADDVREKLAVLKPLLREEVKEPKVQRFDPASRPIWTLAVRASDPSRVNAVQLSTWADQTLRKRLENARGVGSVALVGAVRREINLYLDPQQLEAAGVSAEQVMAAVKTENQDLPAGTLRAADSERVVQIRGRVQRPEDFAQLVVARRGTVLIRLGQVARVVDGPEEIDSLALYNGQRTIALEVQKAQGENTIEVVDGLNKALAAVQASGEVPAGVELSVVRDSSRPIRVSVNNVRQTLLEGAALTILIVFLFLNSWRSTVITGLTLPIALIGTFLFMQLFGFSINMITLMALSLCVGLLIDDAIVVRENIVRHVQMGKSAHDAALDGTSEIGLAVLATTLSIVAVFLPIGFMGGIIGKFFHEFGITIVAAVLISMFVSFTLDPMLSSLWHDPAIHSEGQPFQPRTLYDHTLGRVTHAVDRGAHGLGTLYQSALGWSLRHPLATLGLALATFIASLALVKSLGTEFVPKADYSETFVSFNTPVGSSLEVTEGKVREVEAILRERPEVRYTLATINTGQAQGKIYAQIYIRLVDRKDRALNQDQLTGPLRERLARIPGITVTHVGLLDAVGGNKPLQLSIQGSDLAELQRQSAAIADKLRGIPGLVDLDTSAKPNQPTVAIEVRRDVAADLGLSVGSVTSSLRALVAGQTIGNWRASDDLNIDVKVRLTPEARDAVGDLQRLTLVAGSNADGSPRLVRLGQVADVRADSTANQINRRDLTREVEITANVYGRSLGEVSADVRQVLEAQTLPPGMRWRFGGSTKDMAESFGYAVSALAMGVVFIYMILASQFRSFLQPIALMSSLPLTLVGVVLTLLAFGSTMNLFSIIGVVMLMGLVTKNAILLLDFAIRARTGEVTGQPLARSEALLLAARVRLRPILMTTLAMIFGMVPLAFALSEGSEQRAPMGQAVIGGVVTSSVLTLVVVPVVYGYMDDLAAWLRRRIAPRVADRQIDDTASS